MKAIAFLVALCTLPVVADAQIRAQLVASGLSQPVAFIPDPTLSNVFYIVEQGGLVKVLRNGQIQSEPFIDLRGQIATGGERGLLGMAWSPDVASGRVFVNFTNTSGHTVVARFNRAAGVELAIDPSSRFDVRWPTGERFLRQPFANHNGGNLVFGPDGYLYVGLGDGGSGNDPQNHAQDPSTLLGKMLRLDVAVEDADPSGYRIPSDNPFLGGQPVLALGEIWAFGLRNPWRYSFDDVGPGATGALVVGDVGQGAREEINYEPAGAGGRNYGWRLREGRIATPGVSATTPAYPPLIDPIYDYGRAVGQAITGGYVYRGSALGAGYRGRYFFADYVASRVWSLGLAVNPATGEASATDLIEHTAELGGNLGGIASFGRDRDGELYLVTSNGRVVKFVSGVDRLPHAPVNLTSVVNGSTVVVVWTPPSTGVLAGYQLEAGSAPGQADLGIVTVANTQTSLTFDNVPAGTYYVRVRSLGAGGPSPASNEIGVSIGGSDCVESPGPPIGLTAALNGREVMLSWAAAAGSHGRITFQIEAGNSSGAANLAIVTVDGTQRSFRVQAPPGRYFVRLRSRNACGASGPSDEIVVTVP